MTAPRPKCVHCGKAYGARAWHEHVLTWRKGEPRPEYRGNGVVLEDAGHHGTVFKLTQTLGRPKTAEDEYAFLHVWDGTEIWGGYPPFCTLRCALAYAREAYAKLRGTT